MYKRSTLHIRGVRFNIEDTPLAIYVSDREIDANRMLEAAGGEETSISDIKNTLINGNVKYWINVSVLIDNKNIYREYQQIQTGSGKIYFGAGIISPYEVNSDNKYHIDTTKTKSEYISFPRGGGASVSINSYRSGLRILD